MLEIFICDDEKVFCKDLKKIIETELDLCGISYRLYEYYCGEDFLINYKNNQDNQIIFLDIEMKAMNGIETAKEVRKLSSSAVIIFVTSYSDFVFQGYEVKALNYILKPYEKDKINEVLHTALKDLDITKESCFLIEQRAGSIRLPNNKIIYFFSDRHSVHAVTEDNTYSFYGKLGDIEKLLPACFVRIHNRYIINIKYLKAIENNSAVIFDKTFPISRSCKQGLTIAYARYMLD